MFLILKLYNSVLGPEEVAAWGLLGIIWEELEEIVTAIAEGCVLRCAVGLGLGDVHAAKLVAYKSLWICFVWGVLVTAIFVLFADEIPGLLTEDPVLQKMVAKNIPMMSIANVVSGIGIMVDQILSVQNRAVLQTKIGFATTLLVTLPLGALSALVFDFDLEGLTASISIGSAVFSAVATHAVVCSDWKTISGDVLSVHGYTNSAPGSDDNDDDDSSSSSSSSNSSSRKNHSPGFILDNNCKWCKLPPQKRSAGKILGYNERLWNSDKETRVSEKEWKELSAEEREAASTLGYNETKWNDGDV